MKKLVVYYSKTGATRGIAKKIAKELNAEIDEIFDLKDRAKMFSSITDALFKKKTEIEYEKNPANYELVVVATPVWSGTLTPAIREYLNKNKNKMKNWAFFYNGDMKNLSEIEKIVKKPVAVMGVRNLEANSCDSKIKYFCEKLR